MRASIGERQEVCSSGGHFFVDEGDADADGTDMSILDLRGCDRCSQLFGQIGTQCTEASAERDDRRSMVEHAFGGLVGVQDARLAVHDDHTNIDAVEGATKCFYEIGFCDGGGAAGAGRDAARIFVNPIRNDGH